MRKKKRNIKVRGLACLLAFIMIGTLFGGVPVAAHAAENLSVLSLDTPVTVTSDSHQFMFTADRDGAYQLSGTAGAPIKLVSEEYFKGEDDTLYGSGWLPHNIDMEKGETIYIECEPIDENYNYTLKVTRTKEYQIHSWEDVESVDFYPLRDIYSGIDNVFDGLGAKFTFNDGTTFEYDGLYRWDYSDSYENYMTETKLSVDGWGSIEENPYHI